MASAATGEIADPFDVVDFVVNKGNGVKGLSEMGLKTAPKQYIQPPEGRIDASKVSSDESVPVIDVSNWESNSPEIAESICDAARKWGFFQIVNHGVPLEVLENVLDAGHRFFGLPVEERRKYVDSPSKNVQLKTSFSPQKEKVLEWKDFLMHFCPGEDDDDDGYPKGSAFWPPVSKNQTLEYIKWIKPIIRRLLEVLLKGLHVDEIDKTRENQLMGMLVASFNYYPICPNPDLTAGVGRHSDVSSITVLLQDDTGGLHVRGRDGDSWIHVAPVKGALVINIGDILQIMSNDRYKSIEHWAVTSASKNRISVPVFANPSNDAIVGPLLEALEPEERPIYKQILYSDYFNYFFSKPHDGKQTIEYAKI